MLVSQFVSFFYNLGRYWNDFKDNFSDGLAFWSEKKGRSVPETDLPFL
jgi:hypothetical protein